MPFTDWPLEDLMKYKGKSPKPDDFEEYWSEALRELETVDPQVELVSEPLPSKNINCYHMYFTGVGGARIHAQLLIPKHRTGPVPAVLFFHGYQSLMRDWTDRFLYAEEGFVVASMDCRGQGGLSEDNSIHKGTTLQGHIIRGLLEGERNLLFRSHYLDAALFARIIMAMEEVDENRVGVQGGSQGGALCIACAALVPQIKRAAINYPFLSDFRRGYEKNCMPEIEFFFHQYDPTHKKEAEYFRRLAYIDTHNLASMVKAEVLFAVSLMDNVVPPSTSFAVYNNLNCKKTLEVYPEYGHEGLAWMNDKSYVFMKNL